METARTKAGPDREIKTLRTIVDKLESLPRDASSRVAGYIAARYQSVVPVEHDTPMDRLIGIAYPGAMGSQMRLVNKS